MARRCLRKAGRSKASAAFNQALDVAGAPPEVFDEARSSFIRAEKWAAELQNWAELGVELGTPGKPLRNCRDIVAWCAGEIDGWGGRSNDEAAAKDEVEMLAGEARDRQVRAERIGRARVFLKAMLNLPYFPPSLIDEAKAHIAMVEPFVRKKEVRFDVSADKVARSRMEYDPGAKPLLPSLRSSKPVVETVVGQGAVARNLVGLAVRRVAGEASRQSLPFEEGAAGATKSASLGVDGYRGPHGGRLSSRIR